MPSPGGLFSCLMGMNSSLSSLPQSRSVKKGGSMLVYPGYPAAGTDLGLAEFPDL